MHISTLNNSELVIQANSEEDLKLVFQVAEKMKEWLDCEIASHCNIELWVHIGATWDNYQARELKETYTEAKKEVLGLD